MSERNKWGVVPSERRNLFFHPSPLSFDFLRNLPSQADEFLFRYFCFLVPDGTSDPGPPLSPPRAGKGE